MSHMEIARNVRDRRIEFKGYITEDEIDSLSLSHFDRAVIADCEGRGRRAADWLLALELIFRKLDQAKGS